MRKRKPAAHYADGIQVRDRGVLAQTLTLVESQLESDQRLVRDIFALLEAAGGSVSSAHRIGVTGVPGVGKSTILNRLGLALVEQGHRVAVLAIDPSSTRTGGSILGDKTRMGELACCSEAFVRGSAVGRGVGGVTTSMRQVIKLCALAGFDRVLVETVGAGQSDVLIADLVDTLVLLSLPGSGDDLQAVKRGVLELADIIVVNKADGSNVGRAQEAKRVHESVASLFRPKFDGWKVSVLAASAETGTGVQDLCGALDAHFATLSESGELQRLRAGQRVIGFRRQLAIAVMAKFENDEKVVAKLESLIGEVESGRLEIEAAVEKLVG